MKWFSRLLLLIVGFMCLALGLYAIAWKVYGEASVQDFLATYMLPTHRTMDEWQKLCMVIFWLLVGWSCLYAVGTDIRFQNVIKCKAAKGNNTILLTDAAITRVINNSVRKMPSVYKAASSVTNVFGGGIVVTFYIWWYEGESIVDGGEEARRRVRVIFDRILGVKNLKDIKIITRGLKHRGESDKKIAKAVAGAPASVKKD